MRGGRCRRCADAACCSVRPDPRPSPFAVDPLSMPLSHRRQHRRTHTLLLLLSHPSVHTVCVRTMVVEGAR